MCFHYALTSEAQKIENRYLGITKGNLKLKLFEKRYHVNGFTKPWMPVVTSDGISLMRFGLIPNWIKTKEEAETISTQTLNARAETVFEKPSFKVSILNKRCLIPATGFFEWMDFAKQKYPHFIHFKNLEIFSFGGIYAQWANQYGKEIVETFSIITTEANPLMAKIHNVKKRMPLIIPMEIEKYWLMSSASDRDIKNWMIPYPDREMEAYSISRLITSKYGNSDVPSVLEPFEYLELALAN